MASMSNCRGCGSLLDLTDEQISRAVDEVIDSTRTDTTALGSVCPLCGHPTTEPVSHRKSIQFALLAALLVAASALALAYFWQRTTDRQEAARQALEQLQASADVTRYLGTPVTLQGVTGQVKADETGWQEVRLSMAIRGPRSEGLAEVVGGRSKGRWTFTTLEVFLPREEKRIDVVVGRVVELDRSAFVEAHTQAVAIAQIIQTVVPAARRSGDYPCVSTPAVPGGAPRIGDCAPPIPVAALATGSVDRFDVDLRTGKFVLRQTDLLLRDGDLEVPLTRTYTSQFWMSRDNAFGGNSTHDFDIAPVGGRNPYSYLMLVLPDGDFLYCPRISKGTGYADAVYQHSETSSRFYKAVTRWDGHGWDTRLDDGSRIHFPESYNAKNMAQGAPTEIVDSHGNTVRLIRDRQRNLREIRTPRDRWIRLGHDGHGRVVRADDDAGRSVDYRYSPEGLLSEVRYSDGRARRYTYAGDLLTTVRDEAGRLLIHNGYRDTRVVRQDYANGTSYEMHYAMTDSAEYATEATVVLPGGATRSFRTWDSLPEIIQHRRS
jgi:YD repeat-containing protein